MAFSLPNTDHLPRHPVIVGDKLAERGRGRVQPHIYPANGRITNELHLAGPEDVLTAVQAAQAAFPVWKSMPGNRRRDLMFKLADLLEQNRQVLSDLMTIENGAPVMTTGFTIDYAVQMFRYFGGWTDKIAGRTIQTWNGPAHDYLHYEPYGVVGAIISWNAPLFIATMAIAPALAAGNCVVVKSPELAPYSVMKLGELFLAAGFPPGVLNILVGGPDVGEAMVRHPGIGKVQFVGSGATAKKVLTAAAETLKPCGLELGGKSAVLVFEDADLMSAAQHGLSGAIAVSGQGCANGTRLLVQRAIYDPFIQMLQAIGAHITIGDPLDQTTIMGPIISDPALKRICGMVEAAKKSGGRLVTGGQRLGGEHADGYYLPITIVADVDNGSDLAQHEVFGPVLAVTPFDSESDAIALANGTNYGLGAYIHTQDLRRAHDVASQLQAGQIHINGSSEAMQPNVPFGGMKHSGYGRLGGEAGLHEFLQVKNVWVNLANPGAAQ